MTENISDETSHTTQSHTDKNNGQEIKQESPGKSEPVGVRMIAEIGADFQPKAKNLLLFGSTGETGKQFLRQSLQQGHKVTVVVRSPERLDPKDIENPNVEVQTGDACDRNTFSSYMVGKDAVVSALGIPGIPTPWQTVTIYSQSIIEIHEAMKSNGVNRFIGVTQWMTEDDPAAPFFLKRIAKPLLLRKHMEDAFKMEEYLRTTDLNFTVVRPPQLTKGPMSNNEVVVEKESVYLENVSYKIPRANIAKFMLDCLQSTEFDRTMLVIGLRK